MPEIVLVVPNIDDSNDLIVNSQWHQFHGHPGGVKPGEYTKQEVKDLLYKHRRNKRALAFIAYLLAGIPWDKTRAFD